jgi:hypothetical protein
MAGSGAWPAGVAGHAESIFRMHCKEEGRMNELRFVIEDIRAMEHVAAVWAPVQISGVEVGPVLLSEGGGLFLLDVRSEKGRIRIVHHGARPVLSLSGQAFADGDPVKSIIKKLLNLKDFLTTNTGQRYSIQPVLVFPDAYVDFFWKKPLSPFAVNAIRSRFLPEYLERIDKSRPTWQHIRPEEQERIGDLLRGPASCR